MRALWQPGRAAHPLDRRDLREVRYSDEADRVSIPEGVPSILRRSDVAKVLNLKPGQVAYLTRQKRILVIQEERYPNWWYSYRPEDVAKFAESRQLTPNWSALE